MCDFMAHCAVNCDGLLLRTVTLQLIQKAASTCVTKATDPADKCKTGTSIHFGGLKSDCSTSIEAKPTLYL